MKGLNWVIPRFIALLFSFQKLFLFKFHFLRYLPRLLSKLFPSVIKFVSFHSVKSKLVLLGSHWHDNTDIEASSQNAQFSPF